MLKLMQTTGPKMKIVIIKLSGKTLDTFYNNPNWKKILDKIRKIYDSLLIVHGGGDKITSWSSSLNIQSQFVNGQRVTDDKTMEVVAAVQAGLLNTKIVASLHSNGFDAIGLTGIDKGLFIADYLDKNLGFVGNPKLTGNINWLISLMKENIVPVFSSVCRDKAGNLMNVNADLFTKELAVALNADTVLFLSDVDAIMLNGEKRNSLTYDEIINGIKQKEIYGGMIPKLQSCIELIEKGVNKVWIGNDLSIFNFSKAKETYNTKGSWIISSIPVAV